MTETSYCLISMKDRDEKLHELMVRKFTKTPLNVSAKVSCISLWF